MSKLIPSSPSPSSSSFDRMIDRDVLLERMERAKSVASMVCALTFVVCVVVFYFLSGPRKDIIGAVGLAFIPPVIVAGVLRVTYCRAQARCPHCQTCLWGCAIHSFNRKSITIMKPDVDHCPACEARFVGLPPVLVEFDDDQEDQDVDDGDEHET